MKRSILCVAVLFLFGGGQAEGAVAVSSSLFRSHAREGSAGSGVFDDSFPTAFPTNLASTATDGNSSATTEIKFTEVGQETLFEFSMLHNRAGQNGSIADSYCGSVDLTVDAISGYEIGGDYSLLGDRYFSLDVELFEDATHLYRSFQRSVGTANEVFTVGLEEGDDLNILVGSPTGELTPGKAYTLRYSYVLFNDRPDTDGGAAAEGNLFLSVTSSVPPVPEPSAFAIWSLIGAVSISLTRYRRRG